MCTMCITPHTQMLDSLFSEARQPIAGQLLHRHASSPTSVPLPVRSGHNVCRASSFHSTHLSNNSDRDEGAGFSSEFDAHRIQQQQQQQRSNLHLLSQLLKVPSRLGRRASMHFPSASGACVTKNPLRISGEEEVAMAVEAHEHLILA
jgi:hypothetical protein